MNQELRTIRLFGHLGRKFGKVHRYIVSSPGEAIKAMCCTIAGFREYVERTHANSGFRVVVGGEDLAPDQLHELSGGQEIRIIPVVRGAKNALQQVILGVVIIAAVYFTGGTAAGSFLQASSGNWLSAAVLNIGVAMALGGVAGLLMSPPNPQAYGTDATAPGSYLFGGAEQSMDTKKVPVLYGRLEVPLVPVSVENSVTPLWVSVFGGAGDGLGNWTGDGITTPLIATLAGV